MVEPISDFMFCLFNAFGCLSYIKIMSMCIVLQWRLRGQLLLQIGVRHNSFVFCLNQLSTSPTTWFLNNVSLRCQIWVSGDAVRVVGGARWVYTEERSDREEEWKAVLRHRWVSQEGARWAKCDKQVNGRRYVPGQAGVEALDKTTSMALIDANDAAAACRVSVSGDWRLTAKLWSATKSE